MILLLVLLLLVVGIAVLLTLPKVQTYLTKEVIEYVSEKSDTRIEVEDLSVDWRKGILMDELYIEDWDCDTLFYAKRLSLPINQLALLDRKLNLKGLTIESPYFRMTRDLNDKLYNFQYPLQLLLPSGEKQTVDINEEQKKAESNSGGFKFDFEFGHVHLFEPRFVMEDAYGRTFLNVRLDTLLADVNTLDIAPADTTAPILAALDQLILARPDVRLRIPPKINPDEEEEEAYDYELNFPLTPDGILIQSDLIRLSDGNFHLLSGRDTLKIKDGINFNNLAVSGIQIQAEDFQYGMDSILADLKHLSAKTGAGFELTEANAQLNMSSRHVELSDLSLKTPNSSLSHYYRMDFKSFRGFYDYTQYVKMNIKLKEKSFLTFRDINYFAPQLNDVKYIYKSRDERLDLSGQLRGRVNKLRGKDLLFKTGATYFAGDFRMDGLPDFYSTSFEVNVDRLLTDSDELRKLLVDVNIPKNFDKLGRLDFKGEFLGFPQDLVASGDLKTDLGSGKANIKLNTMNALAEYDGDLALKDFDLGKWLDREDELGRLSFNADVSGKGLDLASLYLDAKGVVQEVTFRDYTYRDVKIDGVFDQKMFDGKLVFKDDNLDIDFAGTVDFNEDMPSYHFKANVGTVDLKTLGLLSEEQLPGTLLLAGDTDLKLKGTEIDNIEGSAKFRDLKIITNGKEIFLDSLVAISYFHENRRTFTLNSDRVNANFDGDFTFKELVPSVENYLSTYFPYRFRSHPFSRHQQIDFTLSLSNPIAISKLWIPQLTELDELFARGYLNTDSRKMKLELNVPEFIIEGNEILDLELIAKSDPKQLEFDLHADTVKIKNGPTIPLPLLTGEVRNDSIDYHLEVYADTDPNRFRTSGILFANVDRLKMNLYDTELVINNKKWEAETGSFMYKNRDLFSIEDILLVQGDQSISLFSYPDEEKNNITEAYLKNIDIEEFKYIPAIENLGLAGVITVDFRLEDVFKKPFLSTTGDVLGLTFLNQKLGDAKVDVSKASTEDRVKIDLKIEDQKPYQLFAEGYYNLPLSEADGLGTLDVQLKKIKAPVSFLNAFVGSFISEVEGKLIGDLSLKGPVETPIINGKMFIRDGEAKVDYLGTKYFIDGHNVQIENNDIIFDEVLVTDGVVRKGKVKQNTATIDGKISLNDLKTITLGIDLRTEDFLFLNTTISDNETFFGKAFGSGLVRFSGPIEAINLYVNAKSNPDTRIFLPISYDSEVTTGGFYTFVQPEGYDTLFTEIDEDIDLTGFNMDFDFDITPDAEIQLIFDQQAGDIIRAKGNGDIQMNINTIGDYFFDMYGEYEVLDGDYLFTLQNVFTKYFTVDPGGKIIFNGDPYEAELDLSAIYSLNTARADLLTDSDLQLLQSVPGAVDAANKRVPIDVYLDMKGSLSLPEIAFKIKQRDNEAGEPYNLVQRKLDEMSRNDENELNKQIFGLLVFNKFMSTDRVNLDIGGTINTTLSELLSNYLSDYLNDVVSGVIPDSELNVNWRNYSGTEVGSDFGTLYQGNEFEIDFTKRMFDDRMHINVGSDIDVGQRIEEGDNVAFAADFMIVYYLTPDGKYQIKGFSKLDNDLFSGDYTKVGVSVLARQEFDNFRSFFTRKKGKKRSKKNKDQLVPTDTDNAIEPEQLEK